MTQIARKELQSAYIEGELGLQCRPELLKVVFESVSMHCICQGNVEMLKFIICVVSNRFRSPKFQASKTVQANLHLVFAASGKPGGWHGARTR